MTFLPSMGEILAPTQPAPDQARRRTLLFHLLLVNQGKMARQLHRRHGMRCLQRVVAGAVIWGMCSGMCPSARAVKRGSSAGHFKNGGSTKLGLVEKTLTGLNELNKKARSVPTKVRDGLTRTGSGIVTAEKWVGDRLNPKVLKLAEEMRRRYGVPPGVTFFVFALALTGVVSLAMRGGLEEAHALSALYTHHPSLESAPVNWLVDHLNRHPEVDPGTLATDHNEVKAIVKSNVEKLLSSNHFLSDFRSGIEHVAAMKPEAKEELIAQVLAYREQTETALQGDSSAVSRSLIDEAARTMTRMLVGEGPKVPTPLLPLDVPKDTMGSIMGSVYAAQLITTGQDVPKNLSNEQIEYVLTKSAKLTLDAVLKGDHIADTLQKLVDFKQGKIDQDDLVSHFESVLPQNGGGGGSEDSPQSPPGNSNPFGHTGKVFSVGGRGQ